MYVPSKNCSYTFTVLVAAKQVRMTEKLVTQFRKERAALQPIPTRFKCNGHSATDMEKWFSEAHSFGSSRVSDVTNNYLSQARCIGRLLNLVRAEEEAEPHCNICFF